MYTIKQSTAETILFFVHDSSGDAVTGLTDGSFTKRISKGSGAWGAMTVTITEGENGWYSIPLSATHSDTTGLLSITFTNAGAKQVNLQWRVEAKLIDDLQDNTVAAIADGVWDEPIAGHLTAGTTGLSEALGGAAIVDTTITGTPTSTTLDLTAGSTTDDFYNDQMIYVLSGTGIGQARVISDYTGSSKTVTVDEPWITTPAASDRVVVLIDHVHPITQIAIQNRTEMDSNSTQLAAIVGDTNELQTDWADGGRLDAILDARMAEASINTTAGAVDTVTDVTNQVTADMTAISGDSTAADNLEASMETLVLGTATGTPTTTTMADSALTEATNDHYNGRVILWRTGALAGQATAITGYNGTTKTFTFTAVTNAASASDAYVVV